MAYNTSDHIYYSGHIKSYFSTGAFDIYTASCNYKQLVIFFK